MSRLDADPLTSVTLSTAAVALAESGRPPDPGDLQRSDRSRSERAAGVPRVKNPVGAERRVVGETDVRVRQRCGRPETIRRHAPGRSPVERGRGHEREGRRCQVADRDRSDPPNVAVVSVPKSSPVTVTVWPPTIGPSDGVRAVMVGPDTVRSSMRVFQHAWIVGAHPPMCSRPPIPRRPRHPSGSRGPGPRRSSRPSDIRYCRRRR